MKKLDYWMINEAIDALEKKYIRERSDLGYDDALALTAKRKGFNVAKECEKELQENRFEPLGRLWLSMRRLEEMREEITKTIMT